MAIPEKWYKNSTPVKHTHCPTDMLKKTHSAAACNAARPHTLTGIACSVCTVDLAFPSECNAAQRDINTIPYVYAKVNEFDPIVCFHIV